MFKLSDNYKEIIVDEGSVVPKGTENAWKVFTDKLPENVNIWKLANQKLEL